MTIFTDVLKLLLLHIMLHLLSISGQAWANTLGIKNAKVYRISGFKKVDEYDIVDGQGVRNDAVVDSPDTESLNE